MLIKERCPLNASAARRWPTSPAGMGGTKFVHAGPPSKNGEKLKYRVVVETHTQKPEEYKSLLC